VIWMVLVSCKGGYRVHSVHTTLERAKLWGECKSYEGEDTVVAEMDDEKAGEITDILENAEK
jgi:hypothetical protein